MAAAMALSGVDDEASEILADTILQLHAPRSGPIAATLVPLEEQFAALFKRMAEHDVLARCATTARRLLGRHPAPRHTLAAIAGEA